jgi:hypothetical protein
MTGKQFKVTHNFLFSINSIKFNAPNPLLIATCRINCINLKKRDHKRAQEISRLDIIFVLMFSKKKRNSEKKKK